MLDIHSLSIQELKEEFLKRGEKPYRAAQIFGWVYKKGEIDIDKLSDLSKSTREMLKNEMSFSSLKVIKMIDSEDQETTKFLFELPDGKKIESVLIRSHDRRTVCVSSQVGCPARCAFCASGKNGLIRNLSASEIFQQVYLIDLWLKGQDQRVSHVVFMGMGEPFENYDEVIKSIRSLMDPDRLGLSQRKITVSTVGVIEGIEKFTQEGFQVNLVLSLHAPNQRIRQKIIPYARKYALGDILKSMLAFYEKTGREITYEYTLIEGINDQIEHAEELAKLVQGHPCTVNLIPYNPVDKLKIRRPEKEAIVDFRRTLESHGISTTWRYTKGKDIAAACGQLALQN